MIWLTLILFGCGLILWGYVPGVDFWTIWVTFKLIPFLTTFLTRSTTFSTLVQPLVQPNYFPAQGGANHQRQDIALAAPGGSTASSMLAADSGANISSRPRLVASSPDAISQAGDHVAS